MTWTDFLSRFRRQTTPTEVVVLAKADAAVSECFGSLLEWVDRWALAHDGRYPQFWSHALLPADGRAAPGEAQEEGPALPPALPCALFLSPYEREGTPGVALLVRVLIGGVVWVKCLNLRGPDGSRTAAWTMQDLA